jgi:hypothetical protein
MKFHRNKVKSGKADHVALIDWDDGKQYAVSMPHLPKSSFVTKSRFHPLTKYWFIREHLLSDGKALFEIPFLHTISSELDPKTNRPKYIIYDAVHQAKEPTAITKTLVDGLIDLIQRCTRIPTSNPNLTLPGLHLQNNIQFAQNFCQNTQNYYDHLKKTNPSVYLEVQEIFNLLGVYQEYFHDLSQAFATQLTPSPVSVIYFDLNPSNILYERGDIQRKPAFIDWNEVCIGDPLYTLAQFKAMLHLLDKEKDPQISQKLNHLFKQNPTAIKLHEHSIYGRRIIRRIAETFFEEKPPVRFTPLHISWVNQAREFSNLPPLDSQKFQEILNTPRSAK